MKKFRDIFILFLFITVVSNVEGELNLSFLDRRSINAENFILQNPEADGRGIVVFILDSGVDPSVKGLLTTSEGKPKVIEMRDFTEQVKLKMNNVEVKDNVVKYSKYKLEGVNSLELKPDGNYYISILDEDKYYKNSAVKDINNNSRTDDKILILSFKVQNLNGYLDNAKGLIKPGENMWVYYVDEDNDGHIDDEKARFEFKYNLDWFNFHKEGDDFAPQLAFSVNFDENHKHIIINTNDNAHGTHCAGIATGYKINGVDGYDGIAPGAYVASLKIGNDVLSGGATVTSSMEKAYEYGIKFMKEAGFKYAVYSMSYGIGSEEPGRSVMESFLEDFAENHPEVVIVKSMGNSGPGINTVGNPSTVNSTLTVGAMISPETLKDLYGSGRNKYWITHFSSRGGCVSQPDVVASGAAASTVPNYQKGDAFWGTSMSTPQVAGACALLFSAALKSGIKVDGFMIRKALKYTSKKIEGYQSIDYGNGLLDIVKAWDYLKILSKRKEFEKLINYDIVTENTWYDDNIGNSAYWNAGGYLPKQQEVTIKAIFPKDLTENSIKEFYRILSLKTDVDWLYTDKSKIYLKGNAKSTFNLIYDNKKLSKPGIYSARVYGFTENEENGGYPDFDFQVTIVVPYKFNEKELEKFEGKLNIGDIHRYFVEVPAMASSMHIKLKANKEALGAIYVYNPRAENKYYKITNEQGEITANINGDELINGVWEIIPYCNYKSTNDMDYKLTVEFRRIQIEPSIISEYSHNPGENPEISFDLYSYIDERLDVDAVGGLQGYEKTEDYTQSGEMNFTKSFKINDDISKVVFKIEMPIEDFNKMTDIAINIYDNDGKSLVSDGMERKDGVIKFFPSKSGEYKLEIVPGFVSEKELNEDWNFTITEQYYYNDEIPFESRKMSILPQKNYNVNLNSTQVFTVVPDGYNTFGYIQVINNSKVLVKKRISFNK